MFLYRLAAGLVFLAGVGLSRLGVAQESWPILALGLLAATVGLWHFLLGGSATARVHKPRRAKRGEPQAGQSTSDADPQTGQ